MLQELEKELELLHLFLLQSLLLPSMMMQPTKLLPMSQLLLLPSPLLLLPSSFLQWSLPAPCRPRSPRR